MSDSTPLSPGSAISVPSSTQVLTVDVRWNAGAQTAFAERVAVAAVPYVRGRIPGREHLVFTNQPSTPDAGLRLGEQDGIVEVEFTRVPLDVERMSVVVYVAPRPNAPRRGIGELDALNLVLRDTATREVLGTSMSLHGFAGSAAAVVVCDVLRENDGWNAVVQSTGHEGGLEAVAAAAGLRL